jgi:hypothetical protein
LNFAAAEKEFAHLVPGSQILKLTAELLSCRRAGFEDRNTHVTEE